MKHCPKCFKNFDDAWDICFNDGTNLVLGKSQSPEIKEGKKPLTGVGGWLAMYVWTILICYPLALAGGVMSFGRPSSINSLMKERFSVNSPILKRLIDGRETLSEEELQRTLEAVFDSRTNLMIFLTAYLQLVKTTGFLDALNLLVLVAEIYSAYALLKLKPGAVSLVKKVILARLAYFGLGLIESLPKIFEISSPDYGSGGAWAITTYMSIFVHNLILWYVVYLYFVKSRRVKNTYLSQ